MTGFSISILSFNKSVIILPSIEETFQFKFITESFIVYVSFFDELKKNSLNDYGRETGAKPDTGQSGQT